MRTKQEIMKDVKDIYGMPTAKQYDNFPYELQHKGLREWAQKFGMTDLLLNIENCLKSGFGYIGEMKIDSEFMLSLLGTSDESIINAGYLFLGKVVILIDHWDYYDVKVV